jgi:FHS family Na+ dependent glucose MFS transporter 1
MSVRGLNLSASAGKIPQTIGYYLAFIALGLSTASMGPTLPGLAEHTQTHLSQISFLFTARSLGYLFGSILGGRLYDRVAGHPVMAATLILMAGMLILVPLMPLLGLLTLILLILGMAEAAVDVGGNTLLVWVHRHQVGPFMNGLHFFFGVGSFLSPIIIAQAVLLSGDITWAYWMLAFLMLPMVAWLLRLPSPTSQADSRADPPGQVSHYPTSPLGSIGSEARQRLLVVLIAFFLLLYVGAEVSFGGWIYTYALALGLSGATIAAYLTSAFWGALTLGRLLAIPIATRFRPRAILFGDLVGCLVSLSIILLWSKSLVAVWLGTFGMGLSVASIFPTTISLAERRMPITGRVTGWFFVGASAGGMTLPWVIGQLFESIGPRVTMFTIMADLIVAVGVFALLMRFAPEPAAP